MTLFDISQRLALAKFGSILRYCRYSRDIHFHVSRDIFMSIYARKNRAMHFA